MNKKTTATSQHTQLITKKRFLPKQNKPDLKNHVNIRLYDEHEFHIPAHRIDAVAAQILGSRKTQQDMFSASSTSSKFATTIPFGWAVVCDGMGGMSFGEVASQTVNDIMSQVLQSTPLDKDVPIILNQSIRIANEEVKKIGAMKSEVIGTTLVCAVAYGNTLHYASVGDSRIYFCRKNEIVQLTRDHNYALELSEMVAAGKITAEEAQASKQKEALISYMGIDELTLVDISQIPITMQDNDIVILCSDGLTKVLSDQAILSIVQQCNYDAKATVDALLSEVQLDPVRKLDNTTIAVLKYINN